MNLSLITKNIETQTKAGEEAKRFQTVLVALDKVCNDNGFKDYADFLEKVAAYEEKAATPQRPVKESKKKAGRPKKGTSKKGSGRTGGRGNKISAEIRAAVVSDLKAGKTGAEVAAAHGISLPSVSNIKSEAGMVKPRKKKKKDVVSATHPAPSNVATLVSSDPAVPTG